MRTKRGSRDSAFSLFSFQDILTTTIGVVLLVLLVLVLDISMDTAAKANAPQASTATPPMQPQLDEASLSNEVRRLSTLVIMAKEQGVNSASQELGEQTRRSLEAAQQRLLDAREAQLTSRNATDSRRPVLDQLHNQIETISARIETLQEQVTLAWGDTDEIVALQERRAEHGRLKQQLDGLLANDALMYIKQADKNHQPILVEITRNMIQVHAHGIAPGMPMIEFVQPDIEARCEAAVALLAQLADARRYPLLLVKPSGAMPVWLESVGTEISPASYVRYLLNERKINNGLDLITTDQQTAPSPLLQGGGT